jgi:LacI family transcriptional regulator
MVETIPWNRFHNEDSGVKFGACSMSTIIDVAKRAGVSTTTVSRFLNENGPISKGTAEKIKSAISELNYRPSLFAKGMRTNSSKTIGILIPDYKNMFYPELFQGIDDYSREHGYMTLVTNTDARSTTEFDHIEELIDRQVDGLILFSYNRIKKDMDYLVSLSQATPIVVMDPLIKNEPLSYVVSDGFKGTVTAVDFLLDRGREKIGYIRGPNNVFVTKERFRGYKAALAKRGIPFDEGRVATGDFSIASGFHAAKKIVESGRRIDAIMAVNDMMAVGVIKYLNSARIRIPQDINVIGFDNIAICEMVEPALTTIAQPIGLLGRTAAEIIVESNMEHESLKRQFVLDTSLVIRDSTS